MGHVVEVLQLPGPRLCNGEERRSALAVEMPVTRVFRRSDAAMMWVIDRRNRFGLPSYGIFDRDGGKIWMNVCYSEVVINLKL